MAVLNTGIPIRLANGTEIRIYSGGGSSYDTVVYVEKGTLQLSEPGRAQIEVWDGPTLGDVIQGDERPLTGRISFTHTAGSLAGTNNLIAALRNEYTAPPLVRIVEKTVVLRIPDSQGSTTGTAITLSKWRIPDGWDLRAARDAPDTIETPFSCFVAAAVLVRYP